MYEHGTKTKITQDCIYVHASTANGNVNSHHWQRSPVQFSGHEDIISLNVVKLSGKHTPPLIQGHGTSITWEDGTIFNIS